MWCNSSRVSCFPRQLQTRSGQPDFLMRFTILEYLAAGDGFGWGVCIAHHCRAYSRLLFVCVNVPSASLTAFFQIIAVFYQVEASDPVRFTRVEICSFEFLIKRFSFNLVQFLQPLKNEFMTKIKIKFIKSVFANSIIKFLLCVFFACIKWMFL